MSGHKIITIGRHFGSAGREIGQKLAERLGIPLYDRRLVSMAAEALPISSASDRLRPVISPCRHAEA